MEGAMSVSKLIWMIVVVAIILLLVPTPAW
jgi:hypothetical protein